MLTHFWLAIFGDYWFVNMNGSSAGLAFSETDRWPKRLMT